MYMSLSLLSYQYIYNVLGHCWYKSSPIHDSHVNVNLMIVFLQLTPVGTSVFRTLTATDKDAGRNGDIDFHIIPGDGAVVSYI